MPTPPKVISERRKRRIRLDQNIPIFEYFNSFSVIERSHMDSYSNKKLSCRKEAERCFMSLLSHSRSFKVIRNYTDEYGVY